jgi:hypothetical protein
MSLGCLRGLPTRTIFADWPVAIKSCATLVFRDLPANQLNDNLITLAHDIWTDFKIKPTAYPVQLELVIEPLKALFHLSNAFALDLGMVGYGRSEQEAAAANDWLAAEVALVINQL